MDFIGALYMDLVLTWLIILSKSFLLVSLMAGVLGGFNSPPLNIFSYVLSCRCTNPFNDLDRDGPPIFRTHEHYAHASRAKSATQLHHEYGYVSGVDVSIYHIFRTYSNSPISCSQQVFLGPASLRSWHQTSYIKLSRVHSKTIL
jgi:hypothetical protein